MPPEVKEARKLNQAEMILIFNKLIHMTVAELKTHYEDPKTPQFERIVCKILKEADTKGDHYRLDFILNRLIGKVQDKVEHSGSLLTVIEKLDGGEVHLGVKKEE